MGSPNGSAVSIGQCREPAAPVGDRVGNDIDRIAGGPLGLRRGDQEPVHTRGAEAVDGCYSAGVS